MFNGCSMLTDIKALEKWNVSNGKDFRGMFTECSSLTDIKPLEKWNVSNGEDFRGMFSKCSLLTDISPIESWNVLIEIKICLFSNGPVGKTSILDRFCKNTFNIITKNTIGGAYYQRIIEINNKEKIKFHLWDTSGNERFMSMSSLYYRGSQVSILVYDVTDEESFNLIKWINELKDKVEKDKMILYLVGNKNDMDESEKRVATSKGKEFAEKNNMIFYEVSAKTGSGINELFLDIAKKTYICEKKNYLIK